MSSIARFPGLIGWSLLGLALAAPLPAQDCCVVPAPVCQAVTTYRISYDTVFEERQVTAYRLEYETQYEQQQVTSYRPVWETETRERRYMVSRPVYETSEREERFRVQRPVYETQMVDRSYDQVRQVLETAEREERIQVARPIYETTEREERFVVRRQVVETAEREEIVNVAEPVTTFRTELVDRGCFVDQQFVRPGNVYTTLRWQPSACVVDPATGCTSFQRGGLFWTPVQGPSTLHVQRVWRPNVVAQQVPQTSLVQRQMTRRVPVQTVRYVDEEMVRKVPQQVCRMVYEEQVRKVPYTVARQVVERIEQQVPVTTCRMVEEEVVRKVPTTTCRLVNEERVEQYQVQVCKQVAVEQTIQIPRTVCKQVPVTYTYRVPHLVERRECIEGCPTTVGVSSAVGVTVVPGTGGSTAPAGGVANPNVGVTPAPALENNGTSGQTQEANKPVPDTKLNPLEKAPEADATKPAPAKLDGVNPEPARPTGAEKPAENNNTEQRSIIDNGNSSAQDRLPRPVNDLLPGNRSA